jgi:hypothetical protein
MKTSNNISPYFDKHFKSGWWLLFFFVCLGLSLESLHGFKISWYLDASNETRRFLFTLGHAHGALLAIINILFALSIEKFRNLENHIKVISPCLLLSSILLPSGFLLGGLAINGGDPGVGIILAIIGAITFVITIGLIAMSTIEK